MRKRETVEPRNGGLNEKADVMKQTVSRIYMFVMKLLEFYNKKYKQTIIMVTHDMSLARRADRIITMLDGKIIKDESNDRFKH